MPKRFRVYLLLLVLTTVGVASSYSWSSSSWRDWQLLVVLGVLTFVAESVSFEMPVLGSVSLAFAFNYAALLYAGPLAAAVVAMAGSVSPREIRDHKPLGLMAFNVVQLTLTMLIAGIVYLELGGIPLQAQIEGLGRREFAFGSAAAVAAVVFILNVLLVSLAISLARRLSLREVWRMQGTVTYLASFVGLALLGAIMAQLMALSGWIGILLLLLPLVVARQTFQVSQGLSRAYSETIKSLVSAIEAKDPYTRGHSERVAGYSRLLGEAVLLPAQTARTLEYAALLHDVGKIGVPTETLVKVGGLTPGEFGEIRRHPEVGQSVLEAVQLLEDVVPIIYAHHERLDGSGYPRGLRSDEIPLEAKILSVADCFDAMTSNRAYRRPMTIEEARVEMARVAGSQLDERLVEVFLHEVVRELSIDALAERIGVASAH